MDLAFRKSQCGSVYEREVKNYLSSRGIKEFSRFSTIDLPRLEDEILSANKNLSFVSLSRRGNRLIIDSAVSGEKVDRLNGDAYSLCSDVDGVVESVKVYRGTPVVEVGQLVKKGDLLVDGVVTVKEQTLKINVIACVSLLYESEYEYRSSKSGEEEKAKIIAETVLGEKEPVWSSVRVKFENGQYIYTVSVSFRRVLLVG